MNTAITMSCIKLICILVILKHFFFRNTWKIKLNRYDIKYPITIYFLFCHSLPKFTIVQGECTYMWLIFITFLTPRLYMLICIHTSRCNLTEGIFLTDWFSSWNENNHINSWRSTHTLTLNWTQFLKTIVITYSGNRCIYHLNSPFQPVKWHSHKSLEMYLFWESYIRIVIALKSLNSLDILVLTL